MMALLETDIQLFGAARCHKTQFYRDYFLKKGLEFVFFDVEKDDAAARELRALYTNGKLNFPTILIKDKKLRNPKISELEKWLQQKKMNNT